MSLPKKPIYLNNAATSFPKPPSVIESVSRYIQSLPFHEGRGGSGDHYIDLLQECRQHIADLFAMPKPERVIFTAGATEALNLAIHGLSLDQKHVITTTIEHNSVLRPLKTLEQEGCIDLTIIPCDSTGSISPDHMAKKLQPNTALIIVNHCSNVTGSIIDLQPIGKLARKEGICFAVDASQSAGLYPIDMQELCIDLLIFTGHKWLYGLQGTGCILMNETVALKPLKTGGTGARSDLLLQPQILPMLYEAGTHNVPGIVSLLAGVDYIKKQGMDTIRRHNQELTQFVLERFKEIPGITVFPQHQETTLFSFTLKGMDVADIGYMLEHSFGLLVRWGLHCAPLIHEQLGTYPEGSIRVSPSFFNTLEDMQALLDAVYCIERQGY